MKKMLLSFSILLFLNSASFSQNHLETSLDKAFQNAKKGIYWALQNVPISKKSLENDLISDDILVAKVKLTKEVEGVKIIAHGFYLSNEIQIITYKSFESLVKEGYLKPEDRESTPNSDN